MTLKENEASARRRISSSLIILLFAAVCASTLSPFVNEFTKSALSLCFSVVIGSVFPFMILTDVISTQTHFDEIAPLRRIFERLFKINGAAFSAFLSGAVCGFPLGVKVATDLYGRGFITRDECERLIGFSNNTGPAFVISGIGVGLLKSYSAGIIIYISMILSAVLVGILLGLFKTPSRNEKALCDTDFDFVASIKKGSLNTLNICGFVVIFSVISGIVSLFIKNETLYAAVSSFIEVSSGAKAISGLSLGIDIKAAFSAFAVSFSGLSVHLQAKSFIRDTDISMKRYYKMKLLQGALSFVITLFLMKIVSV